MYSVGFPRGLSCQELDNKKTKSNKVAEATTRLKELMAMDVVVLGCVGCHLFVDGKRRRK